MIVGVYDNLTKWRPGSKLFGFLKGPKVGTGAARAGKGPGRGAARRGGAEGAGRGAGRCGAQFSRRTPVCAGVISSVNRLPMGQQGCRAAGHMTASVCRCAR